MDMEKAPEAASQQLDTWTSLPTKEYDEMNEEIRQSRIRLATARQILGKIGAIVRGAPLMRSVLEDVRVLAERWKLVELQSPIRPEA